VFSLERAVGVANGSLAVAAVAALLACVAGSVALVPSRRGATAVALSLGVAVAAIVSVGAVSVDNRNSRDVTAMSKADDVRWVDHARLGRVDVLQTDGAPPERTLQQLFFNTSLQRVVRLGAALPVDVFDSPRAGVAPDGRLIVGGVPERRPLLV